MRSFLQSSKRDFDVGIGADRPIDQRIEFGVVERLPPLRLKSMLRLLRRRAAGADGALTNSLGRSGLRRVIIGPDRAACQARSQYSEAQ